MKHSTLNGGLDAYKQVGLYSGASYADPHQLICMLMDGALSRMALAKGAILRSDVAAKGKFIGEAITIIGGLRGCLDGEAGGELANNLDDLYDYMARRLVRANVDNDIEVVEEVHALLQEIHEAWEGIPQPVRDQHSVNQKGG